MILTIDFSDGTILHQDEKGMVLKVLKRDYSMGCHLFTTEGNTMEDFINNDALCGKTVFIGGRGGISVK